MTQNSPPEHPTFHREYLGVPYRPTSDELRLERLVLELEISVEKYDRTLSKERDHRGNAVIVGHAMTASLFHARDQDTKFGFRAQAMGMKQTDWRDMKVRVRMMSFDAQKKRLEELNHILNPESISNASSSKQDELATACHAVIANRSDRRPRSHQALY